jgi:hypothetical protein
MLGLGLTLFNAHKTLSSSKLGPTREMEQLKNKSRSMTNTLYGVDLRNPSKSFGDFLLSNSLTRIKKTSGVFRVVEILSVLQPYENRF